MSNILNNVSNQYSHVSSLQLENVTNPKYLLDLYSFIPLRSVSSIKRVFLEKPKFLLIAGILLALFSVLMLLVISSSSSVLFGILSLLLCVFCLYRYFTASNAALLKIFEYGNNERTYYGTNEEINAKFNALLNAVYVTLS
jgi:hypothetical protein